MARRLLAAGKLRHQLYKKGFIILSTKKRLGAWDKTFGGDLLTANAVFDRLFHHRDLIAIN